MSLIIPQILFFTRIPVPYWCSSPEYTNSYLSIFIGSYPVHLVLLIPIISMLCRLVSMITFSIFPAWNSDLIFQVAIRKLFPCYYLVFPPRILGTLFRLVSSLSSVWLRLGAGCFFVVGTRGLYCSGASLLSAGFSGRVYSLSQKVAVMQAPEARLCLPRLYLAQGQVVLVCK